MVTQEIKYPKTVNQLVVGSIPTAGANLPQDRDDFHCLKLWLKTPKPCL